MKVLVACEFSGVVREAFKAKGHDAWSCDFLPTEILGQHIQGDVLKVINNGWDLLVGFPPCTFLCVAGLHYSKKDPERMKKTMEALGFFIKLYNAPIGRIALENPVGIISTKFRKPDQIINPCNFGEAELKKTCLWLRGLPPLMHTSDIKVKPKHTIIRKTGTKAGKPYNYYWREGKSAHDLSRTFQGIANAMADQWG